MGRKRKDKPKEIKPVRILKEVDKHGRVISTRIIMSMKDYAKECWPELYAKWPEDKKDGDVIQFPQKKQ